ncbi:MAG: hypothetical protein CM15mP120_21130 [Pseudomonadota bacterium]|nr:MAG: hypothetical protein CM15mP120_21130 [Pseudomonadota bacterium]
MRLTCIPWPEQKGAQQWAPEAMMFIGEDQWTAYEFFWVGPSWQTPVAQLNITVPADSQTSSKVSP